MDDSVVDGTMSAATMKITHPITYVICQAEYDYADADASNVIKGVSVIELAQDRAYIEAANGKNSEYIMFFINIKFYAG